MLCVEDLRGLGEMGKKGGDERECWELVEVGMMMEEQDLLGYTYVERS